MSCILVCLGLRCWRCPRRSGASRPQSGVEDTTSSSRPILGSQSSLMSTSNTDTSSEPTSTTQQPQAPFDISQSTQPTELQTIADLISKSESLRDQPSDATRWLQSLKPKLKESRVAEQIANLSGKSKYLGQPSTFFDVLVNWLTSWSRPLQTSDNQSTSTRIPKATEHVAWLLKFIKDYVKVMPDQPSMASLDRLVCVVTPLSNGSHNSECVPASIGILYRISERYNVTNAAGDRIIDYLGARVVDIPPAQSLRDVNAVQATKALVKAFVAGFHQSPQRSLRAYEALLRIVRPDCKFRGARIEAMRVLFRLRRTDAGLFYLADEIDNKDVATALCKTQGSIDAFSNDIHSLQRDSAAAPNTANPSSYENLWLHDWETSAKFGTIQSSSNPTVSQPALNIDYWIAEVVQCLRKDSDWETFSYCLTHATSQLNNMSLFKNSMYVITQLREAVCTQLVEDTVREPPTVTGLRKSDTALCLYHILTALIPYATIEDSQGVINKMFGDEIVRAFLRGIANKTYEGTDRGCIHALSLCAFQIPKSLADQYPSILDKVSTSMSKTYLTVHILEFLAVVATLPEVHSAFQPEEVRKMFVVCTQFLERAREHGSAAGSTTTTVARPSSMRPGLISLRPPYRAKMMTEVGEPKYASALAYHTIICWFLSVELTKRKEYVPLLIRRLVHKNMAGHEMMDEQSEVLVDMMQRTAFSDLGETLHDPNFAKPEDGPVSSQSWIVGYSIITAETAGTTGHTQITKRQASGTTYATYRQLTATLPPHHTPSVINMRNTAGAATVPAEMLPAHILLQMVTTAAPTSITDQPVPLPQTEVVDRAITIFDRYPTVDSYKVGILYIEPGQTQEHEILMNQAGSSDYENFLDGLGTMVSLQPPCRFTTHGLAAPGDGESTIAWRDRVTELVFLVSTMMPLNTDEDPEWITKKAHIGNCHVNIIFDRSGTEWGFEKFSTAFNSVNIVITPAGQNEVRSQDGSEVIKTMNFYKVHVRTKEGFPNVSPAAEPKTISESELARFVRILAINASVFSQVWSEKDHDSEFPSAWRSRLREIKRLRERVVAEAQDVGHITSGAATNASAGTGTGAGSGTATLAVGGGRRTPVPREDASNNDGALAMQLDFGRWTS